MISQGSDCWCLLGTGSICVEMFGVRVQVCCACSLSCATGSGVQGEQHWHLTWNLLKMPVHGPFCKPAESQCLRKRSGESDFYVH